MTTTPKPPAPRRASLTKPAKSAATAKEHAKARRALAKADPALGRLMDRVGAYTIRMDAVSNLYTSLAESIVYQQLHAKAAATIFGRVTALGKQGFPAPQELLALSDESLRAAGLSAAKLRAVRDLAEKQASGALPTIEEAHTLDDEVLVERLTAVRGIGRWTVEMMLIFRLGRPDVLPTTDYGVQQGFQRAFRTKELPKPKQIALRGERWRPYRTMASWYLWRANELPK